MNENILILSCLKNTSNVTSSEEGMGIINFINICPLDFMSSVNLAPCSKEIVIVGISTDR